MRPDLLNVEHRQRTLQIDRLVAGDGLSMVFQPIADLVTGKIVGVEALARFNTEPRRPPNEWFAEAARVGRGTALELAAVRTAIGRVADLPEDVFMSVNVSAETAMARGLPEVLEDVPGSRIVLELTEHTAIDDFRELLVAVAPLRDRGVGIAVDDAGAGYAGLCRVLSMRPDIVKLDMDLTRNIDEDPARQALATMMVAFGQEIGATISAEGVEKQSELDTLRRLGIPWAQGYLLARPGPLPLPSSELNI